MFKKSIRHVALAAAVVAGGTGAGVVLDNVDPTPAQASSWIRVCNMAPVGAHPVRVLLANGASQTVYPANCSSNVVNATHWKPDHGSDVATWAYTDSYYTNNTYTGTSWKPVGRSVTIKAIKSGFSGGGSF